MAEEVKNDIVISAGGVPDAAHIGTRWQVIRFLITKRFGLMVKTNIWMLIFALPAVAVLVIYMYKTSSAIIYLPFSSNAGGGLPYFNDVIRLMHELTFKNYFIMALLLIPSLAIAGMGFAGGIRIMNLLASGEEIIKIRPDFFKGVKQNFWRAMLCMLIVGIFLAAVIICFFWLPAATAAFWPYFLTVLSFILLAAALIFAMFFLSISDVKGLKAGAAFKNSLRLSVKYLPQNIIFAVISLLPMALFAMLAGNQTLLIFGVFIAALLGLSFITVIFSAHTGYVFAREGMADGEAIAAVKEKEEERRREKAAEEDRNPGITGVSLKDIRSIDDGGRITPLSADYSRNELNAYIKTRGELTSGRAMQKAVKTEHSRQHPQGGKKNNKKKKR